MSLFGMAAGVGLGLIGNVVGGILGKGVSSAMDLHSSKELIEAQLQAQKDLFEYENKNKHQFEVEDLRSAGLNPMLSAMNPQTIGVGGVSAPNWTSDDDVYSSAKQLALQQQNLQLQDRQVKAAELSAAGNFERDHAQANAYNTESQIKLMKADVELANIVKDLEVKDQNIQLAKGQFQQALSMVHYNKAAAMNKIEDTIGRKLSNAEQKMFVELLNDPAMDGTPTKNALILAKNLNLPSAERIGLVAAISGHRFRADYDKHERSNSAKASASAFDDIVKYNVD